MGGKFKQKSRYIRELNGNYRTENMKWSKNFTGSAQQQIWDNLEFQPEWT